MITILNLILVILPLIFLGKRNIRKLNGLFTSILSIIYILYIYAISNMDPYIFIYLPIALLLLFILGNKYKKVFNILLVSRIILISIGSMYFLLLMYLTSNPNDYYGYYTMSTKEFSLYIAYFILLLLYSSYITYITGNWWSKIISLVILTSYLTLIHYLDYGIYLTGDINILPYLLGFTVSLLVLIITFNSIQFFFKRKLNT